MHVLNWLSNIYPFQRPGCGNDVSYTVSIIRFKLFSGYRFSLIFLFNISSSANSIWSWRRFSEQLAVKYRLGSHAAELVYFPSLSKWLLMVGVSAETYEVIQSTVRSLEELKEKTECELKSILLTSGRVSSKQIPEDLRRLCRSRWIVMNQRCPRQRHMYNTCHA